MYDYKIKLGRNIKEIRQNARLSVNQLAYYFGVKPETLKDYESGNLSVPTLILSEYIDIKNDNGKEVKKWIKKHLS